MIAYAGWVRLSGGHLSQLTASAVPNLDAISAA
jgi:hypothetical protein